MGLLRELGQTLLNFLLTLGAMGLFLLRLLRHTPGGLLRFRLVVHQVHNAGALSLIIVMTSGLFVGLIMGLQIFDLLTRFNSENALGAAVALALIKELGPVVTALLFAGRAGTALASEIGLMKATDQLSAMEMMAVDPMKRVILPRFLGGVISMPLLVAIFSAIGIFGAWAIGVGAMGSDPGVFWSQMHQQVGMSDVWEGIFKSLAFGVAASLIAVYEGYTAWPTAEGVGRATTRTVVVTAVAVLVLDYMITAALL